MSFSPTGIVGCLVWLEASGSTSQGGLLSNNTIVTKLNDLSGSGNNYSFTTGQSGSWVFPVFQTNVLNGYPAIHFSGTSYLSNILTNPFSLNTIAAFVVYRTPSGQYQPILANWATPASQTINFVIGATGVASPSQSGTFSFLNDTNNIVPNSSISPNSFILRSDRHRSSDGKFIQEYFGTPINSGTVTLSQAYQNNHLGHYIDKGSRDSYFQGDLCELILYGSGIADSDALLVTNYLKNKYFPIINSGPIPSITGCFFWYAASSIGNLSQGQQVTYWPDFSASGNNLSFVGASGSQLPVFIPSQTTFNNNPIVRFSGTVNYLSNGANNNSLNFSPSSVTIFSVYTSPVSNSQQTLLSIDNVTDRNSALAIGIDAIGADSLNTSGWFFSWGKGGNLSNNGWFSIGASSTTNGFQVQQPNALTIRYDRFRPQDGKFAFGLGGVDIATGIANTQVSTHNLLNVAFDNTFNNSFIGDVAELIGYNHQLTDIEVSSVYNYLQVKYTPTPPVLFQADYFSADYSSAHYHDPDYWDLLPAFRPGGSVTQKSITASLVVDTVLTDQVVRTTRVSNNLVTDVTLQKNVIRAIHPSVNLVEQTDLNISIDRGRGLSSSMVVDTSLSASIARKIHPSINLSVDISLNLNNVPGSSTPFIFPTDLPGLFAWYRSTSVGTAVVDGSPVTYWKDDSGSGNNLTFAPFQSGSWSFPSFYNSQINGYPSIRWINTPNFSYLSTNSGNNSLIFSSGDFSGFVVFRTSDTSDEQCLYSLDTSVPLGNRGSFVVGINRVNNGFNYSYGNGTELTTTGNSPTFGTSLYDAGTFMIRHDRFRQSDGEFFFGRYGADVASGVASTNANISNQLTLGYSRWEGRPLIGDIAEVVLYRRKLSDTEIDLVNTYLLLKYRPSNVGGIPLFLFANTDNNSGIYNDRPLYVQGNNFSTLSGISLYTGSSNIRNSGMSLYQLSIGTQSGVTTLYTQGGFQQYPPLTLFVGASTVASSTPVPLFTQSSRFLSNNITLYISGSTFPFSTGSIPLFIGSAGSTSSIPNNNIYLYTAGWTPPTLTGSISLFLDCDLSSTTAGLNSLRTNIPLYLEAGKTYVGMPLYLQADPNTSNFGSMPLFIGTPIYTGYYNINVNLFLNNNVSGFSSPLKRLFVKGAGGLAGGSIVTASMPLFLKQSGVTPTIVGNSNNISLYTDSALSGLNSFSLYTSAASPAQSGKSLFTYNSQLQQSGVSLYATGRDIGITSNPPLFVHGF